MLWLARMRKNWHLTTVRSYFSDVYYKLLSRICNSYLKSACFSTEKKTRFLVENWWSNSWYHYLISLLTMYVSAVHWHRGCCCWFRDADVHIGSTSVTLRPSTSLGPLSSRSSVKPSERSTSARTKHTGRLKLAPITSADRLKTPHMVK